MQQDPPDVIWLALVFLYDDLCLLTGVWKPYDSLRFINLCTRDSILACKDGCNFTGTSFAGDRATATGELLDTTCDVDDGLGAGEDFVTEGDLIAAGEAVSTSMNSG